VLKYIKIPFQQALNKHFILGQNPKAVPIVKEGVPAKDQMIDLEVKFTCGDVGSSGTWSLLAATEETVIPEIEREAHEVDP